MVKFKQIGRDAKSYATGALLGALAFTLFAIWSTGCGGSGSTSGANSSNSNGQPLEVFGSQVAQVDMFRNSTTFTNASCGTTNLSGPIIPDQNGNFTVTGLYASNIATEAIYTGNIQGGTMQLTVTNQKTGALINNYTLTLGVSGLFTDPVGACP